MTDTREHLAAYAHEAWSGWMNHLFKMSGVNPDGSVTVPPGLVERYQRLADTPYADLGEGDKDKDRVEADRMLAILGPMPGADLDEQFSKVYILLRRAFLTGLSSKEGLDLLGQMLRLVSDIIKGQL